MKQKTIHIENLSIGYLGKTDVKVVADRINAGINCGELTCLLGANGVGKSTLLRTLSAFQPKLGGKIEIVGKEIDAYTDKELSTVISVVLTEKCDIRNMTVHELVGLGRSPYTGFWGTLRGEDKEVVERSIALVKIQNLAHRMVHTLSDGERQKVMIAKALVQECPLILLDEPTAFLDVVSRIEIMNLLHRLAIEEKRAILLSTHDIEQALVLSDRLWLLSSTGGLECGVTEDLILRNRMDTLFANHARIKFDLMHGGFSPEVSGEKSIVLKAEDEVLRHWAQNALNRHHYFCLDVCASVRKLPLLDVQAPDMLLYTDENGQTTCYSTFETLLHNI